MTALITGASVGIGASYAKQLAATGSDLVLVARDVTRLEALAAELKSIHGVQVEVLQADLSDRAQLDKVCTRAAQDDIDLVVNNAGFGIKQPFVGGTIEAEQNLLDVLVTAVMRITHAAMPGMIARDRGGVINVSSVAGWMSSGTYSSAKAWVTSFSEALATLHKNSNVHVLALCPGYTRTEFHSRANMETQTIPNWMWLDVDVVVAKSLKDFKNGKAISVPGMQYKVLSLIAIRINDCVNFPATQSGLQRSFFRRLIRGISNNHSHRGIWPVAIVATNSWHDWINQYITNCRSTK